MNPLVSIIIPAYNNRTDIERCVMSCIGQTYQPVEIIVVDDGSTDGTGRILDRIEGSNFHVIHQENLGVSAARDRGAAKASGKYLTFVDADDWIGKDYIARFVQDAERTDADLCISGYSVVKSGTGDNGPVKPLRPWDYQRSVDESYAYHLMATWARFYRTSFWRENHIRFRTDRMTRGEDIPVGLYTNYFARKITITDQTDYYYVQNEMSARHHMRGLEEYSLPLDEIADCVEKVFWQISLPAASEEVEKDRKEGADQDSRNHWYFFEFGVLRTFALIQFDLLCGADRATKKEIYCWETELMTRYFRDLSENPYVRLRNRTKVSFYQKLAVSIYRLLFRFYISRFNRSDNKAGDQDAL